MTWCVTWTPLFPQITRSWSGKPVSAVCSSIPISVSSLKSASQIKPNFSIHDEIGVKSVIEDAAESISRGINIVLMLAHETALRFVLFEWMANESMSWCYYSFSLMQCGSMTVYQRKASITSYLTCKCFHIISLSALFLLGVLQQTPTHPTFPSHLSSSLALSLSCSLESQFP